MLSCHSASTQTIATINKFLRGAFSFVAALAWNAAIQDSLSSLTGTGGLYGYAIIVTVLACAVLLGLTALETHTKAALARFKPLVPLKSIAVD